MARWHLAKRTVRLLVKLFVVSLVVVTLVGVYFGMRGRKVEISRYPSQLYQTVSFPSLASDRPQLGGWYFPAESDSTAVIVHGWSGHRGRWLDLAEYLQRSGINVLTFDLRGGSGRNTYGSKETGDLAGAVDWLKTEKKVDPATLNVLGSSMGALAVIGYAKDHQLGKLALFGPVIDLNTVKKRVLKDRYIFWPALYAASATWVEKIFFGVRAVNPIAIFDAIDEQTLIIHAVDDELSEVSAIRRLESEANDRGQTNLQIIYVPSGDHTFLDVDPVNGFPYSQKIVEFINGN